MSTAKKQPKKKNPTQKIQIKEKDGTVKVIGKYDPPRSYSLARERRVSTL